MPEFATDTPRVERKFSGIDFTVPYVFNEGHVLTKPQTAWLNSNLASVIGNAFSGDIRRGLAALNKAALEAHVKGGGKAKEFKPIEDPKALRWDFQKEFDTKFAEYELGESNRGTGGGAASPVDQLVRMFSTVDIKSRLAKKGLKVAPLYKASSLIGADGTVYPSLAAMTVAKVTPKYPSKWEELVSENIIAKAEQFKAQAEDQLAALATDDDEPEDDLLAGLGDDEEEAEPATASEGDQAAA